MVMGQLHAKRVLPLYYLLAQDDHMTSVFWPQLAVLSTYFWLCLQGSLLTGLGGHVWYLGSSLGWLRARLVPYQQPCFSGSLRSNGEPEHERRHS